MSKIIRNGIEYGGTATTANQVQYSPTETVAEKIDELDRKTGSDIAVSDFDNASIAEKLATIPTSESVPITFNSSQSDYSIPYNNTHVEKYGNVVSVALVPKCVNSYSAYPGQLVYTGLPAPKETIYHTFNSVIGTGKIRLSIDTSGNLYLRWGTVNDEYDCTFTYVSW